MAIDSPTELRITTQRRSPEEPQGLNLGFTLSFISGRGLLTSREKPVGPFEIKVLELEIPNIEFPFDVTGGSDRFKSRRCHLRHLAVSLDADGLAAAMARPSVEYGGFLEVRTAIREGFVQLGGRFAIGEHHADFTMRAAPLIHSPRELSLVFFDTRLYGWLPVPAALLPVYLQRALQIPFLSTTKAGAWTLTPIDDFLRAVLPRAGWKVPDTRHAGLSVADAARGRITLAAGISQDPNVKQRYEREPPAAAVRAGEGIASFARAEESLARGDFGDAYQRYREAWDDERGGRWARERLLQIGASDIELSLETRQLAEETLSEDPQNVQALLALAAIAMRERAWGEAATRYARLADIARRDNRRYDIVAAELAGAAAAAPVDPTAALASYERAAARARDSVIAHQALFEVRRANQDWDGAAKAGERLARLTQDPGRAAEIHRQLGIMHRVNRSDLKRARVHFEKALKIEPDDPAALEGLAETYAARGEPARAATYLARLAEHAEASEDSQRIIALNLRLGEIWERWLGDEDSASRRYQRVLDVDPRNRTARLRLASLAEKRSDWNQARSLYEDLLAVEEERGDPAATSDLVQAYTRLARVTLQTDGATPEAIACLERAVELDPSNRSPREELARVMRERGEWSRLAQLLEEAARHSSNFEEARRARLDAARLQLSHDGDPEVARRHLEVILDREADDPEALDLLMPLLGDGEEVGELITRLEQAADVTLEPIRRADHMHRLAQVRAEMGMDPESQRQALEAALDANPYLLPAAKRLVQLLEDNRDFERLVRALGRLSVASSDTRVRANALVRRATILWRDLERVESAERAFRRALRLVPGDFAAWNQLSRLFEASGKPAEAREALETALAEASRRGMNTAPLFERMAELARSLDDPAGEVDALSRALEAGLRSDAMAQRLIVVLSQLDRGREAAELLEEWAGDASDEDNERLLFQAAELRRSLGESERAAHTFATLVQRDGSIAAEAALALEQLAFERGDEARERLALEFLAERDENRVAVLERLVEALRRHGDYRTMESRAEELLEADSRSPVARHRLAERMEADENFDQALMHYTYLLLETKRERLDRGVRRDVFVHVAGLAHEMQPDLVPRLQEAFDFEFPEAPSDALNRSLSSVLRDEERWEELYKLRRSQIERADEERKRDFEADVAEILHERLGRLEESIPYYQNVIAGSSDPSGAREALTDVFERLGRYGDLARHLFAMSQLASDRAGAVVFGLRSARVYGDELDDRTAAQQILRTLLVDPENDWRHGGLLDALRDFGLYSELSLLTEKSLEAEPAADDGRFAELVVLLTRELNDPLRAASWTELMIQRYPQLDDGWLLHTDLLGDYPSLGSRKEWLRRWANGRDGSARAKILRQLASEHHEDGELELELEVLEEAVGYDAVGSDVDEPSSLELLVERNIASGDWDATLRWLEQLARATEDVAQRDRRWRRLIEIAVDYADQPMLAVRGLESLGAITPAEEQDLTQLYIETGDVAGLTSHAERLRDASGEDQVRAARAVFSTGDRTLARRFLEYRMQQGDADQAWKIAAELWRESGRTDELARWRLQFADAHELPFTHGLRLEAYAELLESESNIDDLEQLDAAAQAVSLDETAHEVAWSVFRIGRYRHQPQWQDRAAKVLTETLPAEDPRTRAVLVFRADRELADGGDPERAVDLARRLLELGEPSASELLERALERAGRTDELIAALEERAGVADDDETRAVLWLRIAELRRESDELTVAVVDLQRIPEAQRGSSWARLARELGQELGDTEMQIQAGLVFADIATDVQARAHRFREVARLAAWSLGDEERGRGWLEHAHSLDPENPRKVADQLNQLSPAEAEQRLQEAFWVFEGSETLPLWRFRFERAADSEETADAETALDAMADLLDETDRDRWLELSSLAGRVESVDRQRRYTGRAYEQDRDLEPIYLRLVAMAGGPEDVIEVLVARAGELEGAESATRFEQAARIADMRLVDRAQALGLYERAIQAHPTRDNLAIAVSHSHELGRLPLVASLSSQLLERLEPEDNERLPTIRRYVDALASIGSDAVRSELEYGLEKALRELVERDAATALDRARLAELLEEGEPRAAAELFEAAARAPENQDRTDLVLAAAGRWNRLGDRDRARELVRLAQERGADGLEAHRLAAELEVGDERLRALTRVVELQGDEDWEDERRHAVRVELAEWILERGELDRALELGQDAQRYGESDAWIRLMEQVWVALEDDERLAELRIETISEAGAFWSRDERVARLRESARYYRDQDRASAEYRALTLLLRELPEEVDAKERLMALMAELGDRDTFLDQVEQQWDEADESGARVELALRYAPVFVERFEDPSTALELLKRAYDLSPSLELANGSLDAAERVDRVASSFEWLNAGSEAIEDAEHRLAVELRLADVAERELDDRDAALAIHRGVFKREPSLESSRDWLTTELQTRELWPELADVYQKIAETLNGDEAKDFYLQAARVVDTHLDDDPRWLTLASAALDRDPEDRELATQLATKHIALGHWQQARFLVERQRVQAENELGLLIEIISGLRQLDRPDEVESLRATLADRHPESPEAGLYRLERARADGATEAVLHEIEDRLRRVRDLNPIEWLALHAEAGDVALELDRPSDALIHFLAALDTPDPEPAAVRRASELASALGDEERLDYTLRLASRMREQIMTEAIRAKGSDRARWFVLLGRAHEHAEDQPAAIEAYRQAFELGSDEGAYESLVRLHRAEGSWNKLVELEERRISQTDEPALRAISLLKMARICLEYLDETDRGERYLDDALSLDPTLEDGKWLLGTLLVKRGEYERGIELLEGQIDLEDNTQDLGLLRSYLDGLKSVDRFRDAVDVAESLLRREPERADLNREYATLLEQVGRLEEADGAWQRYLEGLGPVEDPEVVVPALVRVAEGATRAGDDEAAIAHLERALELDAGRADLLSRLRAAVTESGDARRAAALLEREADLAPDVETQVERLSAAGALFATLDDGNERARVLERVYALRPDDDDVLRQLVALAEQRGDDSRFFELVANLEQRVSLGDLDAAIVRRLAQRADSDDPGRAKKLYEELYARDPDDTEVEERLRDIALATEDYEVFVELEEASLARVDTDEERVERLKALSMIVLKDLRQADRAAKLVEGALELAPDDRDLRRRLADTYALNPEAYRQATALYRDLLEDDLFDTALLRILARLYGQIGDTDRAFGYYAALRALVPSDEEAKRFVDACRKAMPTAPPRPLNDTDRGRGLIHPDQLGPVEELFAPLARFAELTHPGDLRLRGVDERDQLAPTDPVGQGLIQVLEAIALSEAELYAWRGGGFACEVELVGRPAILLGSSLMSDASERQRAFITVRAGELYRTGHTLCDRLSPAQLEVLAAALALAVLPDRDVPGATSKGRDWAQTIAAPMTPQIRQQLAPRVHQYIERFSEVDIAGWRRACLSTAARTALVVTCDIEEAIAAMLRVRGFDDVTDEQRPSVLRESPEELDLWTFALSESYFKLRASLGIALRSG